MGTVRNSEMVSIKLNGDYLYFKKPNQKDDDNV